MWISFRCKSGGLVDHFWVQFNILGVKQRLSTSNATQNTWTNLSDVKNTGSNLPVFSF